MLWWFAFDPREMLWWFGFSLGRCTDGLVLILGRSLLGMVWFCFLGTCLLQMVWFCFLGGSLLEMVWIWFLGTCWLRWFDIGSSGDVLLRLFGFGHSGGVWSDSENLSDVWGCVIFFFVTIVWFGNSGEVCLIWVSRETLCPGGLPRETYIKPSFSYPYIFLWEISGALMQLLNL